MKNWPEKFTAYSKYTALCWGFSIPFSTALTTIFSLLTLALIIACGNWREKITLIRNNPFSIAILVLFLLFAIGCFYSIAPWHTRFRELIRFRELLSLPIILSVFMAEKWRRLGLLVFAISMIIQLIGGTYIHFLISPEHTTITRDHISIGVMMAFLCFVFFHLALQQHGWKRGGFFLLFAMTTTYLLMINTGRTGYVLFFMLLILSFVQIWQWRGLWMAAGLCLCLSLGAYHFSSTFHEQVSAALDHARHYQTAGENAQKGIQNKSAEVTSESLRLQWQKDSLAIIHAYPIFGAGTGAYLTATQKLFSHYDSRYITDKPHSDLLTIGAQLGTIGLLALLAVYLSHAYVSFRIPKPYCFYAQLLLLTMLIGGFFNSLLRDDVEKNFYVYMAALCMAQYSSRLNTHRATIPAQNAKLAS